MTTRIFEIAILVFVLASCVFGVFYSIKLRILSNKITMNTEQKSSQDIVKIFAELEKKAREINPDFIENSTTYEENKKSLGLYQDYVYTTHEHTSASVSNQVIV